MAFRRKNKTQLSCLLVLSFLALPALAVTPEEISKTIKDARILTPGYDIKPVLTTDSALLTTFRNPQASDKDCKVDTVLITRKIVALDPQKFKTVEVYFYDTKNPTQYTKTTVSADDITRFGSGKLSQAQLMDAVGLSRGQLKAEVNPLGQFRQQSYTQILQRSDVVSGPMASERSQLLKQIRQLNGTRIDKRQLQTLSETFVLIEDLARYNQRESLAQQIALLKDRLCQLNPTSVPSQARSYGKPEFTLTKMQDQSPDFAKRQQQMIDALRSELGPDAPSAGPLLVERAKVIKRIKQMSRFGVPEDEIDKLMTSYRDVDYIARHGNADEVARKLAPLNDRIENIVERRQQEMRTPDKTQGFESERGKYPFDGPRGPGGERPW